MLVLKVVITGCIKGFSAYLPSRLGKVLLQLRGHGAVDVLVTRRIAGDPARHKNGKIRIRNRFQSYNPCSPYYLKKIGPE